MQRNFRFQLLIGPDFFSQECCKTKKDFIGLLLLLLLLLLWDHQVAQTSKTYIQLIWLAKKFLHSTKKNHFY